MGDKIIGACLGHSDYEIIERLILAGVRRGASKTFQSVDFGLFGKLVWRVLWEEVLKSKNPG